MGDFLNRHKIIIIFLVIILIPSFLFGLMPIWYLIPLVIPILIIDLVYASKKKKQAFQLTHTEQAERQLSQQEIAKRLEPRKKVRKAAVQTLASSQEKSIFEKAFEQIYCPKCGAAVKGPVCEECGEKIE